MQFLYPNVLFLLFLLFVLIFLITTNKDNLQRFFSDDVLDKLLVDTKSMNTTTRNILLFLALILFVISMARPVMDKKEQDVKQKLIPIVIALDVSKSMLATDIYPSRIALAKKKLKQIIQISVNSNIGIVLFAQNSYILSPITEDLISLNYIVDNLDTSLNFANGSNIFAVLEATNQMLLDYNVKNLIILSDGGNDDKYVEELEFTKENKINIYSIGMATKNGAPIPEGTGYVTDKSGNIVTVALNESIKNLSIASDGGYIGYSLSSSDVEAIINQIQRQSKKEEVSSKKIKIYTELFYYPLALALVCLLISFSSFPKLRKIKNNTALLFLIALLFYPQSQYAGMLDFKTLESAKSSYENGNYKQSIREYKKIKSSNERNYNLANSYYKDKNYKQAIESYGKIVTENKELEYKKLHNLGNSYVNDKNLQKAKEFYEKALKLKDDKQTKENLDAVNKELEKKKQKKDNKDNKNNKKSDKQKKENKDKQKKNSDSKKDDKKKENKNENKDKEKEASKKSDKTKQDNNQQKLKNEPISSMEEKKWLKALQKKKAPIMLQKIKSKNNENKNVEQPW